MDSVGKVLEDIEAPEQSEPDGPVPAPPGTVAHRLWVTFEGEGAGVEELSWGQREIWNAMVQQQSHLPIGGALALPPGTTMDDMVGELRFNMGRHQSMRTRYRAGPDGRVRQVVAGSGRIAMEVFDVLDGDPAAIAEAVRQRYWTTGYDYAHEWPMRMAVVRRDATPTHVVAVVHHLVADGFGAAAIIADLNDRDPVTGAAGSPPPQMQPMAQARWQRGPSGQRQNELAGKHWAGLLREIPARRFPGSDDPRRPRYWEGILDSPAMFLAVRTVAERTRTESSTVLLAAYAVAVARITGIHPVVVQPVVSNRFRPGLATVVSPINQTALCLFDVADGTFDEIVGRVRRKTMTAYKFAYYDPDRMAELVAAVSAERGEEIDIGCFFNDRRLQHRDSTVEPPPTPADIRAARPRTTFRWDRNQDKPYERLFVHVEDVPGTLRMSVCADTHHVSPADIRRCLEEMEAVTVASALDAETRTGVE